MEGRKKVVNGSICLLNIEFAFRVRRSCIQL